MKSYLFNLGKKAKKALVENINSKIKNQVLRDYSNLIKKNKLKIILENNKDLKKAKEKKLKENLIKRLLINEEKIFQIINSIKTIIKFKDPVDRILEKSKRPNGLKIEKQEKDGRDRVINLSENHSENEPNDAGQQFALKEPKLETSTARRPRPKISPDLLRGPVMKTTSNAPRVGMLAVECRLHPYGVYVQEMLRSIEDQWQQLAYNSLSFIQRDRLKNRISYRFTLLADGSISNLKNLDSLGEFSLPAEICRQAIASRVPFGNWTPEMKDDFGESDTITIHFNYR